MEKKRIKLVKYRPMLLAIAFLFLAVIAIGSMTFSFAYNFNSDNDIIDETGAVGRAEVENVTNPSIENKLPYSGGSTVQTDVNVSLDCNVSALLRLRVVFVYYDAFDKRVNRTLPKSFSYNFHDSTKWTYDSFQTSFYYNGNVENIETIDFIDSITFNEGTDLIPGYNVTYDSLYANLKLTIRVEADILQTTAIDFENHPWKADAPSSWLNAAESY